MKTRKLTFRRKQLGMSLVELMIALVLSLLIVSAMTTLFIDMSRSNQEMSKTNNQIENARFAIQFLQNDIIHAGYWGSFVPDFDDISIPAVPTSYPTTIPSPCLAIGSWNAAYIESMLGIPVQAYDGTPPGCAGVTLNQQANTDVLLIRHANTCVPGDTNCEADTAGKLYFSASRCELEIDAGMLYTLDPNTVTLHERDCVGVAGIPPAPPTITSGTLAEKRKFIQTAYYIRNFANTSGDGIPTLVRSRFDLDGGGNLQHLAVEPLVEGIEQFRVELGIDNVSDSGAAVDHSVEIVWADEDDRISPTNRGDGIPDGAYVHCTTATPCTLDQLANVVAVKLYLLARADEPTPGYTDTKTYKLGSATATTAANDGYKRHVFSTSARLHNVAGRRETPP